MNLWEGKGCSYYFAKFIIYLRHSKKCRYSCVILLFFPVTEIDKVLDISVISIY